MIAQRFYDRSNPEGSTIGEKLWNWTRGLSAYNLPAWAAPVSRWGNAGWIGYRFADGSEFLQNRGDFGERAYKHDGRWFGHYIRNGVGIGIQVK